MESKHLQRILRQVDVPNLVEILSKKLSHSDFNSLMLEVFRQRADRYSAAGLLEHYTQNRLVSPSSLTPTRLLRLDQFIYGLIPSDFNPLILSPIAPLGSCSVPATVNQDKVLSASRHTEVVADATNVLALECAKRRKELLKNQPRSQALVKLCTSHRHLRTPLFEEAHYSQHFQIFCMATAGRDSGNNQFEIKSLHDQLTFYLKFMLTAKEELGLSFKNIRLYLTDLSEGHKKEKWESELMKPLQEQYPEVQLMFNPDREGGRGYYRDLCFTLTYEDAKGQEMDLADGGLSDWTQQFLNNKKERLLTSGMGTELLCKILSE